jgi:hypothetical protein
VQLKVTLISRLSAVIVLAEHLAVCRVGLPTLVPRLDVIGLHPLDFFLHFAQMPFCRWYASVSRCRKRPEIQASLIPIQHIRINALLVADVLIFQQLGNLLFQPRRIELLIAELVVEQPSADVPLRLARPRQTALLMVALSNLSVVRAHRRNRPSLPGLRPIV